MPRPLRRPAPDARDAAHAAREEVRIRLDKAADDQKRSFLRMVSHELRTPLNAVIGFSEILSHELYGPMGAPQYKEYAELIHHSGHKLLRLVNQILEIARLQGDAVDLNLGPEGLDHALDDVLAQLADEATARKVDIIVEDGALPAVVADGRGLRTLLFHLLHNAVIYSPEDATVFVRARCAGSDVEIEIQDHGEGVNPEDIARLILPFEQGESALNRRNQGAGLGLSIVALLSQAMGGSLRISSRRGEGLLATVALPAA